MPITRNCLNCDREFSTGRVDGPTAKYYCSRWCFIQKRKKPKMCINRNCLNCNIIFITNKINGETAKIFCSRKCNRSYCLKLGICIDCYKEKESSRIGVLICSTCARKGVINRTIGRFKAKIEVFKEYEGRCQCCGVDYIEFLSIDHINNDGKEHRKVVRGGHDLYMWLKKYNYPKDNFRLLCFNCNLSRKHGPCFHETGVYKAKNERGEQRQKLRKKAIDYYGGKCYCCNENNIAFLNIDHLNGGGTKQRREDSSSNDLTLWIIRHNFPEGFGILCYNCNLAKGFFGYCPHIKEMNNEVNYYAVA